MATQHRSWFVGSLAGLLLTGTFACGQDDVYVGSTPTGPDGTMPSPPPAPPPPETGASVPFSGGSLLVLRDGKTAVAADPDRSVVWVADLTSLQQTARVNLQTGDEPGRLVEDNAGKVHVVLRGGGAIVQIDPAAGTVLSRRAACAAPRGIDYDAATDRLHVACAGGELVSFAASGGDALRTVQLDSDLRDVIVQGDHLLVSRFRSAELLTVDSTGAISGRIKPRQVASMLPNGGPMGGPGTADPAVAWRVRPLPDGRVVMLFQRGITGPVDTSRPGGYGSGMCKGDGIVATAMTILNPSGTETPGPTMFGVAYAVDFAINQDSSELAFAAPYTANPEAGSVNAFAMAGMTPSDPCNHMPTTPIEPLTLPEVVAVAYDSNKHVIAQSLNPPQLRTSTGGVIDLKDATATSHPGRTRFHTPTGAAVACASCHPEVGDDGRVWNFSPIGPRRTQNLRGGLLATAPFHWNGDMTDMATLMTTVFVGRMGGQKLSDAEVAAVGSWLDAQPALAKAPPADAQAVARGKQLFEDATVGCNSCHAGAHYTNNQTVNVGTGGSFQVPSLIGVALRAPYLHNGCAATLTDRFNATCGGGDSHGKTSQLSAAQIGDLVSYLQTL